jgi:hypothetical protein
MQLMHTNELYANIMHVLQTCTRTIHVIMYVYVYLHIHNIHTQHTDTCIIHNIQEGASYTRGISTPPCHVHDVFNSVNTITSSVGMHIFMYMSRIRHVGYRIY